MDYQLLKAEVEQKTAQTIEVLRTEYAGLRTGRASVHLLDAVRVPVYGSEMPINQVATVSTPDNQTLSVTVWDITNAPAVEKAIRDSGLGLNPGSISMGPSQSGSANNLLTFRKSMTTK